MQFEAITIGHKMSQVDILTIDAIIVEIIILDEVKRWISQKNKSVIWEADLGTVSDFMWKGWIEIKKEKLRGMEDQAERIQLIRDLLNNPGYNEDSGVMFWKTQKKFEEVNRDDYNGMDKRRTF